MARIRTIKPEFWTDEKIVTLTPLARLLFIGMWNFVDDYGRAEFSPLRLKMQILPADNLDISEILGEIRGESMIVIYTVDNKEYFEVCNFSKHQKVDKRSDSKHPPPPSPAEFPRALPLEGKGMDQGKESIVPSTGDDVKAKEVSAKKERFLPLDELPFSSNVRKYPPPFDEFWTAWKPRATDTKAGAYKAWRSCYSIAAGPDSWPGGR